MFSLYSARVIESMITTHLIKDSINGFKARGEADFTFPGHFVWYAWGLVLGAYNRMVLRVKSKFDSITRICLGDIGSKSEVAIANRDGMRLSGGTRHRRYCDKGE